MSYGTAPHFLVQVFYRTCLASINKSTHVGQPVFSVLFALLSLAGDSPPASKRTKIPRKSKAVRCEAVLPEQKCSQTRKRPQRILCVFSRALTPYEGISARQNRVCPCQSTLTNSTITADVLKATAEQKLRALEAVGKQAEGNVKGEIIEANNRIKKSAYSDAPP